MEPSRFRARYKRGDDHRAGELFSHTGLQDRRGGILIASGPDGRERGAEDAGARISFGFVRRFGDPQSCQRHSWARCRYGHLFDPLGVTSDRAAGIICCSVGSSAWARRLGAIRCPRRARNFRAIIHRSTIVTDDTWLKDVFTREPPPIVESRRFRLIGIQSFHEVMSTNLG